MENNMQPAEKPPQTRRLTQLTRLYGALVCVGFAFFLACSTPALPLLLQHLLGTWTSVVGFFALQHVTMAAGGMALHALHVRGISLPAIPTAPVCAGAFVACYAALFWATESLGAWSAAGIAIVLGACSIAFMLIWFEELLRICHFFGQSRCVMCLLGSYLLLMVIHLGFRVVPPLSSITGSLATACACAALTGTLRIGARRVGDLLPLASPAPSPRPVARVQRYRLVPCASAMLVSFGATYGLSHAALLAPIDMGCVPLWSVPAATAVACLAALAWHRMRRSHGDVPFGAGLRACATTTGAALAFLPLLYLWAPGFIPVVCTGTATIQGITMILFSVIMCHETGAPITSITPINYAVYTLAESAALVACAGFMSRFDGIAAWNLVCLLATLVTVAIIPLLPSRTSNAAAFALRVLPENESPEARLVRRAHALAEKYGLSAREEEVLDLVLRGKTRQQIADALGLSSWTVRDHTGSIYSKTGVHSAKELIVLVGRDA